MMGLRQLIHAIEALSRERERRGEYIILINEKMLKERDEIMSGRVKERISGVRAREGVSGK